MKSFMPIFKLKMWDDWIKFKFSNVLAFVRIEKKNAAGSWTRDSIFGHKKEDTSIINMQKSKSSTNVGQVFSKKIWKSRSKSQTRPDSPAQPHWTPQVILLSFIHIVQKKIEFLLFPKMPYTEKKTPSKLW